LFDEGVGWFRRALVGELARRPMSKDNHGGPLARAMIVHKVFVNLLIPAYDRNPVWRQQQLQLLHRMRCMLLCVDDRVI
jgi:hypothetical protein